MSDSPFASLPERAAAFLYAAQFEEDPQPIVAALAEQPDLLEVQDDRGLNALHLAAASGHTRIVETLLAAGADPNALGGRRTTPLHRAAIGYERAIPSMLLLVRAGARVNGRNAYWETPLMVAAHHTNVHAVTFLLGKGARTDFCDRYGKDALGLLEMSFESAMQNPKKYRQQIREGKLIREMLRVATKRSTS